MSDRDSPPPAMLWPTTVGQDAFVDFSRSPSRDGYRLDGGTEELKSRSEKEKNNKVDNEHATTHEKEYSKENKQEQLDSLDSKREEMTSMKEMKERIKLKTGKFRKHLTEYIKDMSTPSTTPPAFDMEDNNKSIIWDDKGRIKHATLLKLVEKLTSEKHTDTQQIFVFLQTYRTFIQPKKLLELLIARYNYLVPGKDLSAEEQEAYDRTIRKPIRLRVLVVFKYWIELHFLDWDENQELAQQFREFLKDEVLPYGLTNLSEQILRILDKRIQESQKSETPMSKLEHITKFDITVFDFWGFSAREIAVQLTLHEFSLYRAIKPYEFLGLAWTKKDGKKRAPNILAAIGAFNKMVEWLRTEILMEDNLKDRVARMSKILEIANEFYRMNNFNGVVEVIATLESSSIARLKKTWAALPLEQTEACENLKKIVSQEKNFMRYREKLHKIEPPCVPYLGVYLTDLVFIDEGNADTYGEMVNFFKCGMISSVLREIQQYQQTPYSVAHIPMFQRYVEECHGFSEKASYDVSVELEPRTTTAAEEEFGDVGQTPQQYVMYGRIKNKVLNYSDDPFDVQLLLLGAFTPITVRLPPKCNAQQALEIFENNMHGVNSNCALVVHPRAQILDQFAFLSDYSTKKDVLVIQSAPQLIRVGISQSKTMQQMKDVVLDFSSPLFCMIPLFQLTFNVKEEIAFLFVEGFNKARWLNIHKTIAEQGCDPTVGFILIYPLTNIVQKEPPKLDGMDKSGYLSIRQLNSKGFKLNMPKRRFVILQDHFLMFCKTNQELMPYKALCLEHFKAKLGNDQTITLTRSFKGFATTIIKSMTIVLVAQQAEDIADWFAIMQRNCGIIGDQTVFGVDLAAAAGKRGKNIQIPLIIENSLLYLFSGEKKWDNLFNAPANPILLEHFKRLFDQGVNVEFSGTITDPYTVAQLLLSYLDELPAPLLTYEQYDALVAHGSKSFEHEDDLIAELQNVIAKLPPVNKSVLCLLLAYLHESGSDKLGLSIALGPVLLKSRNPSKTNDESKACSLAVMRLIAHQEKLFSGAKEGAIARKMLIKNLTIRPKKSEDDASVGSASPPSQRSLFPRKISTLVIPDRPASTTDSPMSDPNLSKTVLNRYLDLDVSSNNSPPLSPQTRTQRSDSNPSSSFMRTIPSRARGDSDGVKLGSSANLSAPLSPRLSGGSPSPTIPVSHRSSPPLFSLPQRSSPIPTPAASKRTTSETNVADKKQRESNSLPDYLEKRGRSARDIHSSSPTTSPSIHATTVASPPTTAAPSPNSLPPPLNLSLPTTHPPPSSHPHSPSRTTSISKHLSKFIGTLNRGRNLSSSSSSLSASTSNLFAAIPESPKAESGSESEKFEKSGNPAENEKSEDGEKVLKIQKASSVDKIIGKFVKGISSERIEKSEKNEKSESIGEKSKLEDKRQVDDVSGEESNKNDTEDKEHKHERTHKHKRSNKRSKDNKPRDTDKRERDKRARGDKDDKDEKGESAEKGGKEAGGGDAINKEDKEIEKAAEARERAATPSGPTKDSLVLLKKERRKSRSSTHRTRSRPPPPTNPLSPAPTHHPSPSTPPPLSPQLPQDSDSARAQPSQSGLDQLHSLSTSQPEPAQPQPSQPSHPQPLQPLQSVQTSQPPQSSGPFQPPQSSQQSQPSQPSQPSRSSALAQSIQISQPPSTSQPPSFSPLPPASSSSQPPLSSLQSLPLPSSQPPPSLLSSSQPPPSSPQLPLISPRAAAVKESIKMRIARLENSGTPDYSALDSPILKKLNNNFCSQCGEKFLSSDARFCAACGHAR